VVWISQGDPAKAIVVYGIPAFCKRNAVENVLYGQQTRGLFGMWELVVVRIDLKMYSGFDARRDCI